MNKQRGVGGIVLLVILAISAVIGGVCWTYTVNSWLHFFGKPEALVFWQGALLGFVPFIGQVSIPAAVLTWLLMLFVG